MRHFMKKGSNGRHRAKGLPHIAPPGIVTKVSFALIVTAVVASLGGLKSNETEVQATTSSAIVLPASPLALPDYESEKQELATASERLERQQLREKRREARQARKREAARVARKAERKALAEQQAAEQKAAEEAAAKAAAENTPTPEPEPAPQPTPSMDIKQYALSLVGADQFECLDALWTRESNWQWNATNPSSGAYGIPQALPADKMATAGSDWQTNPQTQVDWGVSYIKATYGTPCGAWNHFQTQGWY